MVDLNPTISMIVLNVNGLNIPLKSTAIQIAYKNKIQLYTAYKNSL